MKSVILAWFLVVYTALSGYGFLYALTVKREEVDLQGPIQKMMYWNAVFLTAVLVFGAALSLMAIAAASLIEATPRLYLGM